MSENSSSPLFGIGGVTLLTVLLILCLTLFSVLALSSAQADLRLSEKNSRYISAYYEAENKAYTLMQMAEEMWPPGESRPSILSFGESLTAEYGLITAEDGAGIRIEADIPLQQGACLKVEVSIHPGGGASRWRIRQWQLIPPQQDEADIAYLPLLLF
ncbi:MAG: hypothetical protein FWH28_00560 [Clostridiales bacterium]|nr:hypothetical protein [Clostridiales bacterium]